ncbi:MAG: flagellar hook-length control protein FliK [Campylobacterota bacterium]|nr:flagellar hook-length control protein FliK [Campylobacterota bacterium]
MLVSTNSFLHSIQTNNKTVDTPSTKDTPKNAVSNPALNSANTLGQNQAKAPNIPVVMQNILKDLATQGSTKEAALSTLKNSAVLSNLGTVSQDLKSLMNLLKSDPGLAKFETVLGKFMPTMEKLDASSLQEQIKQSGVFLESKLLNQTKAATISPELKQVLENIKSELSKMDTPQAKQITNTLTELLSNGKNTPKTIQESLKLVVQELKTLINTQDVSNSLKATLQPNIAQLSNLTQQLDHLNKPLMLVESKLQNGVTVPAGEQVKTLNDIKTVLTQIQQTVAQQPTPNSGSMNKLIDHLLSQSTVSLPSNPALSATMDTSVMQSKPMLEQTTLLQNTFSTNVKTLIDLLKQNIQTQNPVQTSQPSSSSLTQLTQKLETLLQPLNVSQVISANDSASMRQLISNDMKATLLQMREELIPMDSTAAKEAVKQVDKMLGQIEYFQALSYASTTQSTFMPFLWDSMQEGEISFKKLKEDKFFVQINLKLKEFGKIDLMVILHDENQLDISMFAQRESFKQIVQENMPELKKAINNVGLIPANVRLLDMEKDDEVKKETNAFVQEQQLGHGISIRV